MPEAQVEEQPASAAQKLHDALWHAVEGLDPALRSVFLLREVEGLSTEATATRLHTSMSTVKLRLHRARRELCQLVWRQFEPVSMDRAGQTRITSTRRAGIASMRGKHSRRRHSARTKSGVRLAS